VLGIRLSSPRQHRVRPGVYAAAPEWDALAPWERYRARIDAYLRTHPSAVLCLESAAAVLGLPLFGEPRDIHVYAPDGRSSRRFGDVLVHTSASPRTVMSVGGIHVTSVVDSVVDLVRVLPPAHGLAVADAAVSPRQGGTLTAEELLAYDRELPSRRGRARARWMWERVDGAAESPAESVSRAVIEWCGYETPELQRTFRYEGCTDRSDFFFPRSNAVGEADGWGKYQLEDPAVASRRLQAEKRREDRLRRGGHGIARWDLADVYRVTPLRTALTAAGVVRERREQPAMLATLRDRRRQIAPPRPAPNAETR
jgi:hypothetical protein